MSQHVLEFGHMSTAISTLSCVLPFIYMRVVVFYPLYDRGCVYLSGAIYIVLAVTFRPWQLNTATKSTPLSTTSLGFPLFYPPYRI